jgi:hypothetical protein
MRNPSLHETSLSILSVAAAVLGLAIAGVPLAVLIVHGQPIDIAVGAGLRALCAYACLLLFVAATAFLAFAAAAVVAGFLGAARRRVGR